MEFFKDYKGFDVNKLINHKVLELYDMKINSSNYSKICLILNVRPFEIDLIDESGIKFTLNSNDFTDTFGEFAPCSRYRFEIIK